MSSQQFFGALGRADETRLVSRAHPRLGNKACGGSQPALGSRAEMDLTFPLGYKVCEWISPSPWEGREERAGRATSFRSIHPGPSCSYGRILCDPRRFVVSPQRPSLREGDWGCLATGICESRQGSDRKPRSSRRELFCPPMTPRDILQLPSWLTGSRKDTKPWRALSDLP